MKNISNTLPVIKYGTKPKVLFIGNGLNRAFNQQSCDEIIKSIAEVRADIFENKSFSSFPFTMKIVVATADNVNDSMKELTKQMVSTVIGEEQRALLSDYLALPFNQIISTNYTYELEQTICDSYSQGKNRKYNYSSIDTKNSINELLYRYIHLEHGAVDKYIWHIHGQAYKPSSVIMGHYYYGKLLSQIQVYIPEMMKRWKSCQKHKIDYKPMSWIDYFIFGEVYMVGFGMDLSEIDLWWLVCCKKRNGDGSQIHFYTPECDISEEKELLMEAYNIDVIKNELKDYRDYYVEVLKQLKQIDWGLC